MTNNNNPQNFTIELKKSAARGFETTSLLILALSYFSFLYKAFKQFNLVEIVVFATLATAFGIWYYNIRRGVWPMKYAYLIFMITGAVWFYQQGVGFAIGTIIILAGLLQIRINETPIVTVDDKGVAIKRIFTRHYDWPELKNVIIKDGLLTIDCKNNRIFQKEAADNITSRYEANFNEFCHSRTPSAP